MSDKTSREYERLSNDPEERKKSLVARLRTLQIALDDVALAADLGDQASQEVFDNMDRDVHEFVFHPPFTAEDSLVRLWNFREHEALNRFVIAMAVGMKNIFPEQNLILPYFDELLELMETRAFDPHALTQNEYRNAVQALRGRLDAPGEALVLRTRNSLMENYEEWDFDTCEVNTYQAPLRAFCLQKCFYEAERFIHWVSTSIGHPENDDTGRIEHPLTTDFPPLWMNDVADAREALQSLFMILKYMRLREASPSKEWAAEVIYPKMFPDQGPGGYEITSPEDHEQFLALIRKDFCPWLLGDQDLVMKRVGERRERERLENFREKFGDVLRLDEEE